MKKLLLLPLLLFSPLFALPIGNPMDASLYTNGLFCGDCYEDRCCDPCDPCFSWCDAWNFRIGFYGDYVFNRHMELDKNDHADIDDFEIFTNAGFLAINICDRLDIFGTLGATNIYLAANPKVFGGSNDEGLDLWTETTFSWSIGGRLTIWNCECWYFGLEGQYFHTKPDVERIIADDVYVYPDDNVDVKYSEWQVGLGAAYMVRVGCSGISAIPFIGLKWAGSCADFDHARPSGDDITLFSLANKKTWGYGVGMTLLFCDALSVTVEGRFADEKAVHVNGQFRF